MVLRQLFRSLGLALFTATALACNPGASVPTDATGHDHAFVQSPAPGQQAEVNKWLADLRGVLAGFHRFEAAKAAGYNTEITTCLEQQPTGGMGFHYGDTGLIDGVVEELKPELLLYEPQKNGRMRLVAVEYIVPFTAWSGASPPTLHGLVFSANQTFQVWALHAWIWQHNPRGMFADWNPRVNCAYAN